MSRRKYFALAILLATAWLLPASSWASGGRLPGAARTALIGMVRANVSMPRCPNARLRTQRNQALSKGLQSASYVLQPQANGNGRWEPGRAYIYEAKIEMPGQKAQNAGSYVLVERQNRNSGEVYWEARALATPLRADGKPSAQATKRITRPKSGEGKIGIAFVNEGTGETYKAAAGITARDALVARGAYRDGGYKAELLAKRVNLDTRTTTYYAMGAVARDASGNRIDTRGVVETEIQGEPAPMFSRDNGPARMIAPPGTGPQRPHWRPEWNTIPVTATIDQASAEPVPAPRSSKK